jgi:hypothetical protein
MLRKLLRQIVPVVASLALTAGGFAGVAAMRRSEDAKWCREATAKNPLPGNATAASPDLLEKERTACALQRHRQRAMFGAVWRTGGKETAECGFELARIQLITDRDQRAEAPLLAPFGIAESTFDASSNESADRFLKACLSKRQEAR